MSKPVHSDVTLAEQTVGTSLDLHWLFGTAGGSRYLCVSVDEPMLSGLRTVLLRALWICAKLGLSVLSFCQQSSINWCRDVGQLRGAGNRNPSSIALIT